MDNRLFTYEKLYCEGSFKPEYRGKIHLWSLLALPYAVWHLYQGTGGFTYPFFIGAINLLGNLCCFGVSGFYHVFDWTLETEIILQKLDHSIISLWCAIMMFPVAILLFPTKKCILYISISIISCIINWVCIYNSKPSILVAAVTPTIIIFFIDLCYKNMTSWEFISILSVFFFQGLGTFVFSTKFEISIMKSDIFGYHELFHVVSLFGAFFLYQLSYSIAVRHNEIKEPVEVIETVETVEPVEVIETVEVIEPVEPVEPVEPIEIVETVEIVDKKTL